MKIIIPQTQLKVQIFTEVEIIYYEKQHKLIMKYKTIFMENILFTKNKTKSLMTRKY